MKLRCSTKGCRRKVIGVLSFLVEGNRWHETFFCRKHTPKTMNLFNPVMDYVKLG